MQQSCRILFETQTPSKHPYDETSAKGEFAGYVTSLQRMVIDAIPFDDLFNIRPVVAAESLLQVRDFIENELLEKWPSASDDQD